MADIRVLAFAGSTRKESSNQKLLNEAAEIARQKGAIVTMIHLDDYPMPFYNADLESEQGMPASAKEFRSLMISHDAIIIASPEYNASIPGMLKNALDWASRSEDGKPSREAFQGKKFGLMSASPGKLGGARGLVHLSAIVQEVGGLLALPQTSIPSAYTAFDAKGLLIDPALKANLEEEIASLLTK